MHQRYNLHEKWKEEQWKGNKRKNVVQELRNYVDISYRQIFSFIENRYF